MDEGLKREILRLRRAGRSRRQIRDELGLASDRAINEAVQGVPPAAWTRRPNAKDDLRQRARQLRTEGMLYRDIARELGVSLSSVSLWVRDLPNPPRVHPAPDVAAHMAMMRRARWDALLARREVARDEARRMAAAEIPPLDRGARMAIAAVAYWCEGAKSKPWRRTERVTFINSDPLLIRLFLRFLADVDVPYGPVRFRLSIHESADVVAATAFWADVVGVSSSEFQRPTLKRNVVRTVRYNTGDDYHGCLVIAVTRSAPLYRFIEGVVRAVAEQLGVSTAEVDPGTIVIGAADPGSSKWQDSRFWSGQWGFESSSGSDVPGISTPDARCSSDPATPDVGAP